MNKLKAVLILALASAGCHREQELSNTSKLEDQYVSGDPICEVHYNKIKEMENKKNLHNARYLREYYESCSIKPDFDKLDKW